VVLLPLPLVTFASYHSTGALCNCVLEIDGNAASCKQHMVDGL
jgi:hypothetical protein